MLTRSGACLRPPPPAAAGAHRTCAERALQPARDVVHVAGTVDRHADVLEEARRGEIGQRFGPLVTDDGSVCRQVPAA